MGWLSQNFSVPAGNIYDIYFDIFVDGVSSLVGYEVVWQAFVQSVGVPTASVPAIITKTSLSGGGILVPGSPPLAFTVTLDEADTVALLRNYYHEASLIDPQNNVITVARGIMTVTGTESRV
jgi:hypothetical protein